MRVDITIRQETHRDYKDVGICIAVILVSIGKKK